MTRALTVWWEGAAVGSLALDGQMQRTYSAEWLAGTAPRRSRARCRKAGNRSGVVGAGRSSRPSSRWCTACIGCPRPGSFTGQRIRAAGASRCAIAGALSFRTRLATPLPAKRDQTKAFSDEGLVGLLKSLPTRPFVAGAAGRLRLSLARVQSKMPVVLVGNQVALPAPGQPTTHILKPPVDRSPATVENERLRCALPPGSDSR